MGAGLGEEEPSRLANFLYSSRIRYLALNSSNFRILASASELSFMPISKATAALRPDVMGFSTSIN